MQRVDRVYVEVTKRLSNVKTVKKYARRGFRKTGYTVLQMFFVCYCFVYIYIYVVFMYVKKDITYE